MNFKRIEIEFIPQDQQRYQTLGDYWEEPDRMVFKITQMSGLRSLFVLVHEIWECYRTLKNGIKECDISDFDIGNPQLDDPGLDLEAPYHKEHMESDVLERMCCVMDGDDWVRYEQECEAKFEE